MDEAKQQEVLDIIAMTVDETTLAIVRDALADSHRMTIIRDAFLAGRDHEAVNLDPRGLYKLLPTSSGAALIEPTMSAQITATPQTAFRATRLMVSRRSRDFMIADIRVGTQYQFVQAGEVPADIFAGNLDDLEPALFGEMVDGLYTIRVPDHAIPLMGLPISCPESDKAIVITVTNIGVQPASFDAAWLGFAKHH